MSPGKMFMLVSGIAAIAVMTGLVFAKRARTIPNGGWGGQHIQLTVANGAATIEYDCANGRIEGPLKIDRRGRFDLRGTHRRERGGPVRLGESETGMPARYTGWTDGKRMTLTVTLVNEKTEIGTFELTHGKVGRVFKCL